MRLSSGLSMAIALALALPAHALEVDTSKILPKSLRGKEGGKQASAFVQPSSVVRKRTARVIYGKVSVYGDHDTGSGAVEVVDQGGELEILGDEAVAGEIWYKVRTKEGKEGWVQQSLKNIVLGGGYDLKKAGPPKAEGEGRSPVVAAPKIMQQKAAENTVQQHAPITFSLSQPPAAPEGCTVTPGGRLAPNCTTQASVLPPKPTGLGKHEDLSTVKEAPESKIEVEYRDVPVRIPVSGSEINVIAVPYPILDVDTSKENLKELGKAEREFSISVLQNVPTDVAVRTAKKTFLLTLIPTPKTASLIVVRDAGPGYQQGRAPDEEGKEFPYPEMLVSLMDSAEDGLAPEGYATVQASKMYDTPEVLMVLKKEFVGVKYKVVSIDIVNKTGSVIRVREDMPFILTAISKLTDRRPLGVRLLREFLQPRAGVAEARGEFVTTLIAVVGS